MKQRKILSYFNSDVKHLLQACKIKTFAFLLLLLSLFATQFSAKNFYITAQERNPDAAFIDTKGHFAQIPIETWSRRGIIKGSDSKFRPNSPITRGEFAVIINRLLDFESPSITRDAFIDLQDRFYKNAMLSLNENKILLGFEGKLRAEEPITREEAAVILLRAFQVPLSQGDISFADQNEISDWARDSVSFMTQNRFMNGYEQKIHPKKYITRGEFVKLLDNMITDYIDSENKEIGSKNGFVLVKTPLFRFKNQSLNHPIIFSGNVEKIEIEKSQINSKLVIINNLFKNIIIKESKIADMSSNLKNIDIQVDKNSTLPNVITDLKNKTSGLKNVQIKTIEKEAGGAPIANNDSDVYQPILPDDPISEQTPPKKEDKTDEAVFREDLWIYIEGISNNGEIILKATDDLSNFELPKEAIILNSKNGENTGHTVLLQWDQKEEQAYGSKLEDIRKKKVGQYSFKVETLSNVIINETNYKRVKLQVIIKLIP